MIWIDSHSKIYAYDRLPKKDDDVRIEYVFRLDPSVFETYDDPLHFAEPGDVIIRKVRKVNLNMTSKAMKCPANWIIT